MVPFHCLYTFLVTDMAVAKSPNSMQTMRWSEKEYTLEELVKNYRNLLPFPVLVTFGCWIAPDYSVSSTNEFLTEILVPRNVLFES